MPWHHFLVYFKIFYTFAEVQSNGIKSLDFGRKVLLTFFFKKEERQWILELHFLKSTTLDFLGLVETDTALSTSRSRKSQIVAGLLSAETCVYFGVCMCECEYMYMCTYGYTHLHIYIKYIYICVYIYIYFYIIIIQLCILRILF